MKHVTILIPQGDSSLSNLEASHKMFTMTNSYLQRMGKPPQFQVQLAGASSDVCVSNGLFTILPEITIDRIKRTDLIIIPAVHGDIQNVLKANSNLIHWIGKQYKQGSEVASLCIGAFILASTGLLTNKHCATHWLMADEFRKMFPDVQLVDDKIITDEQGLYTSGGAYSSLNLNLYLIEKFAGREMAVLASKIFEIDIERNNQSPFIIFRGQKDHQDKTILDAQEFIETNFQAKITVDQLTERFGVGRRTFERRFKTATSNTILEYLQRVKMEAAKKQLEAGRMNVNEVMYDVGYTDSKSFREVFKKTTGMSPIDYRKKYMKADVK